MKRIVYVLAILLPALGHGQRHDRHGRNWRVEDKENVNRTFDVSAGSGPQKLLVDNVNGYIHVTGYSGRQIQLTAVKQIGADSSEAAAEGKRDVKLDISQQGNFVRLYVDGPFRSHDGVNYRGDDYYGYRVYFDFDIQVPFATELVLKTVNDGAIEVKKTSGDYDIHGLNGGIEMDEISGSGFIGTLNGPLKVTFAKNPVKSSEFRTLNGRVDVYFQPGLNADLNLHTLNGGVYTDFDITSRPTQPQAGGPVNGRFTYRSNGREMAARAGSGGPELTFHALNGPIRLHSKSF